MGAPEACGQALDMFVRHFTHHNYFCSHNAFHRGISEFLCQRPPYVMQLDGTSGFAAALMDALAYRYAGRIHVTEGIPSILGEVEFTGIRFPGNQAASGTTRSGQLKTIPADTTVQ
jgi:hypothetical protein